MTTIIRAVLWFVGHIGAWALKTERRLQLKLPEYNPDADQIDPADVMPNYTRDQ